MSQVGDTRSTTTGPSARVGYTRVSTVSQTLDQQQTALDAAGVVKRFPTSCPAPAMTVPVLPG
jgi:hypothetical protein